MVKSVTPSSLIKIKLNSFPEWKNNRFLKHTNFFRKTLQTHLFRTKCKKKSCNIPNQYICTWPTSYEFLEHTHTPQKKKQIATNKNACWQPKPWKCHHHLHRRHQQQQQQHTTTTTTSSHHLDIIARVPKGHVTSTLIRSPVCHLGDGWGWSGFLQFFKGDSRDSHGHRTPLW